MFHLLEPADSFKDTTNAISDYLIHVDYQVIQDMIKEILKCYKPETEYETSSESGLYNFYSVVTTYVSSKVRDNIYAYTRKRVEDLQNAIKEINQYNIISIIFRLLNKEDGGYKTTSVNSLLLHGLIKNLNGYNTEAILSEESLMRLNKILLQELKKILCENSNLEENQQFKDISVADQQMLNDLQHVATVSDSLFNMNKLEDKMFVSGSSYQYSMSQSLYFTPSGSSSEEDDTCEHKLRDSQTP